MGDAQPKKKISIEEYLEIESQSDFKYEYHDGEIYAMAGGTIHHAMISGNIYSELKIGFKTVNANCIPFNGDAKILIKALDAFVYPDASAVCGKIEESEKGNGICNPILIIEVLSKSTGTYDRGDKFKKYRQLPSLQEYVLIEQDKASVEVFYEPSQTDLWRISSYEGLADSVKLDSVSLNIPMSAIYADVLEV